MGHGVRSLDVVELISLESFVLNEVWLQWILYVFEDHIYLILLVIYFVFILHQRIMV